MGWYRYTPEMLAEAARESRSIAGVMRYLGIRLSGGAHAHISRRLKHFGIDTSHFTGQAHNRGGTRSRLRPEEVLVVRDRRRRRAHPDLLRRALAESGVPERCAGCETGPTWQGRPLTLHVDHRNGTPWDCRPENLRLLCPNCHSQTPTYAGRNRRRLGIPDEPRDIAAGHCGGVADSPGSYHSGRPGDHREVLPEAQGPVTESRLVDLVTRIDRRELTVVEAAAMVGCSVGHFHRLRQGLERAGTIAPRPGGRRWRATACRDTVVAAALAHPDLGPKPLTRLLRAQGCAVGINTVATILREAGLNTVAARRSRLTESAGVAEWQTRQV